MQIRNYVVKTLAALVLAAPIASCSLQGASESALSGEGSGSDAGTRSDDCTFTQGYWKNHPDAWPVASLELGSVSYDKDALIAILKTPVKGNGLVQLAHQLIAAKLNIAAGASDVEIRVTIEAADKLIGSLVVGEDRLDTKLTSALNDKLDAFNNGKVGPGHCDDKDGDDGDDGDNDCDHDDDGDCDDADDHDDCDHEQPVCGNGVKEGNEACDDGNTQDGDGCSATCTVEEPVCVCGDGIKHETEACDDGNLVDGDGCSSTCTIEVPVCGNGVIEVGETCDDGNTKNGDGCSSVCLCEHCP
jgi:cysteine-rich repeat protein